MSKKKNQYPRMTLDEVCVVRDAEGKVLPIEAESALLGRTLLIRPLTYGFIRTSDDMSKPVMAWPIERKVELMQQHVVDPDMSKITVEGVKANMDPMIVDHIVSLVMVKSSPFSRLRGSKGAPAELILSAMRATAIEAVRKNS